MNRNEYKNNKNQIIVMSRFFHWGKGDAVSSLLNIVGMAVAFAALYILLVQVHGDLSYNRGIPDAERVYRASAEFSGTYYSDICRPLGDRLIQEAPGIESGGLLFYNGAVPGFVRREGADEGPFDFRAGVLHCYVASEGILNTLGIRLLTGNWAELKGGPEAVALSESASRRLGVESGDEFEVLYDSHRRRYRVAAIFTDPRGNGDFSSLDLLSDIGSENEDRWDNWNYTYHFKLYPDTDPAEILQMAETLLEETRGTSRALSLTALPDTYYDASITLGARRGNRATTLTFIAVALLVLLTCFINSVNFFFSLVPVRMRYLNTRRIFGASRGSLVFSFVGTAVLEALVAALLAAVLVRLFGRSNLDNLLSYGVAFQDHAGLAVLTLVGLLLLTAAVSVYPALYATSFAPAFAVRSGFSASSQGRRLRYALIGLQFVISLGMVICSTFIRMQRNYMMNHDMGFDRENLVILNEFPVVPDYEDVVADRLRTNPGIVGVSWAVDDLVADSRMAWTENWDDGERISYSVYPVSWNFLRFMGIEITEGRDFMESDRQSEEMVFVFNETARQRFGLTLEKSSIRGKTVGFCRDFNFQPLSAQVEPLCFCVYGKHPWQYNNTLFVRTAAGADIGGVFEHIRSVVHELAPGVTAEDLDVRLFDDALQACYSKESHLSRLLSLASLLTIFIALMGVFGLVLLETEYRRKEIGIRRVNGASMSGILVLFNMRFVRIVLVCFVIAAPVSLFVVQRYLENFAYRIPVSGWVFVGSLAAVLALTVLVVTLRSWSVARANPVDSIRNE